MKHAWTRGEAWGKATAALVGGLVLFVAFSLFTGVVLPRLGVGLSLSVALGVLLGTPVWAAAITGAVLARSGLRAWLLVGGACLAVGGAVAAALVL
jgi:hypothetical protein